MVALVSTIALFLFPFLMAFAASSDLLTMRISNILILTLVVGFLAVAPLAGLGLAEIGTHAAVAVATLVVGFVFFAFRWIGGGDAKLAAATMLWVGLGELLPYLVYASLLGGALTLLILGLRRWPLPEGLSRVTWLDRLHDSRSGVPYGIALAIAGILVYLRTDIFQSLSA
jgi:prepilin peptidase CpaA